MENRTDVVCLEASLILGFGDLSALHEETSSQTRTHEETSSTWISTSFFLKQTNLHSTHAQTRPLLYAGFYSTVFHRVVFVRWTGRVPEALGFLGLTT